MQNNSTTGRLPRIRSPTLVFLTRPLVRAPRTHLRGVTAGQRRRRRRRRRRATDDDNDRSDDGVEARGRSRRNAAPSVVLADGEKSISSRCVSRPAASPLFSSSPVAPSAAAAATTSSSSTANTTTASSSSSSPRTLDTRKYVAAAERPAARLVSRRPPLPLFLALSPDGSALAARAHICMRVPCVFLSFRLHSLSLSFVLFSLGPIRSVHPRFFSLLLAFSFFIISYHRPSFSLYHTALGVNAQRVRRTLSFSISLSPLLSFSLSFMYRVWYARAPSRG